MPLHVFDNYKQYNSTDYTTFLQMGNSFKRKTKSYIYTFLIATTSVDTFLTFRLGVLSLDTVYIIETKSEEPTYHAEKKMKMK